MASKSALRVEEILHQKGDTISEAEYVFEESLDKGKKRQQHLHVKRAAFDELAVANKKLSIKFDDFLTVVRLFLMGEYEDKDIIEAFTLLDTDQSNSIDLTELATFMPVIVPGSNKFILLRHFEPADTNKDYTLCLEEFTAFVKKGVIRDLALGRI